MAPPISICVLAVNEQDKIEHALQSARRCDWCDEIIVFDSGSTDRTVEIARRHADRVEHHDWVSFSHNRRRIVEAARNDWVFLLDADEEISSDLAEEIGNLTDPAFAQHPVFDMPRKNYLLGRHVVAWNPDRVARLIDRRRVEWPDRAIHDVRIPTEGTLRSLRCPVLHNAHADSWPDYFDGPRYARRAEALAREMYDRGRRANYLDLLLRPCFAFCKFYFFKFGFLQGTFGLLIAQKASSSVQLKYARLWQLAREAQKQQNPQSTETEKTPGM